MNLQYSDSNLWILEFYSPAAAIILVPIPLEATKYK